MTFPAPPNSDALRERLERQLGGTFAIARELGGGGSARVFLATEVSLGRTVVLKVLPTELTHGIDAERFRREILIAARLQHPHLVPLLAAGTVDEDDEAGNRALRWFSMPFVEGQTLREHLTAHAPLPVPDSLRLLRALAAALAYAHGRGVMHRDIKPENILLSDGVVMIADFGVAKALEDASEPAIRAGRRITTASATLGTPAYMSPEQITGALEVDHRADLYAFGCVAYEMLTGTPPLLRGSLRATMAAQVNDRPVPVGQLRPDLPTALDELIMYCLQKDIALRPPSGASIVEVLDRLSDEAMRFGEPVMPETPMVSLQERSLSAKAIAPGDATIAAAHGTAPARHGSPLPLVVGVIVVAIVTMVLWGLLSS